MFLLGEKTVRTVELKIIIEQNIIFHCTMNETERHTLTDSSSSMERTLQYFENLQPRRR